MSPLLQQELGHRLAHWQQTCQEDTARLRGYQRELAYTRQLPARPHASISLLLRQCAAARRIVSHARQAISLGLFRLGQPAARG